MEFDAHEQASGNVALFPALLRGDETELAQRLHDSRTIAGPVVFCDGIYREYDETTGTWPEIDESVLSLCVQGFAGTPVAGSRNKPLKVSSGMVRGTTKLMYDIAARPGFFDSAPAGIAFSNGFVQVHGGRISVSRHSADARARYSIPFPYNADASHEELDKFFDDIFADVNEDERAARVMLIQEFVGACLIGQATSYQRCLVFEGAGGNGKSQVEEVLRAVFPSRTVCSLAPQHWGERFQIAKIVGCLANIVDEIPEKDIVSGDLFKSVITGEPIHVERKHRDPFEHRPIAGHIFSANMLPSTADLSHGFFRRFMIIKFGRDMENAAGSRKDAARHVIASDLHGIAAWAIAGAARLQQQGKYTEPESSRQAVAEWKRSSDSVAMFLDERTVPADTTRRLAVGNGTKAGHLYKSYQTWTSENGYRAVSAKNFSQRAESLRVFKVRDEDGFYYPVALKAEVP